MCVEVVNLISSATVTEYAADTLQRNPPDTFESVGWVGRQIMTTWIAKLAGNCRETENVVESS